MKDDWIIFPGKRSLRNFLRLAAAALAYPDETLERERERQANEE